MSKVLRIIGALIMLVVTVFVNLAGYTFEAWVVGVVILVSTIVPLNYFAEKFDKDK